MKNHAFGSWHHASWGVIVGINAYVSRGNLVDTKYSGFSKDPSLGAPRKFVSPGIRKKVLKWIQNYYKIGRDG